jgi:hypothetical protein
LICRVNIDTGQDASGGRLKTGPFVLVSSSLPASPPSTLSGDVTSSILSREDSIEITSSDPAATVKRENALSATLEKAKSSRTVHCKKNDWICFTVPK